MRFMVGLIAVVCVLAGAAQAQVSKPVGQSLVVQCTGVGGPIPAGAKVIETVDNSALISGSPAVVPIAVSAPTVNVGGLATIAPGSTNINITLQVDPSHVLQAPAIPITITGGGGNTITGVNCTVQ